MTRTRQPLRRKSKDQAKQNMMYLIILILLIIFFTTIGFKFVINASLWLSGNSREDTTSSKNDDESLLVSPELFGVPDATNSAQLEVTGRGTPKTKLTIYVNDAIVETMELDEEEFDAVLPLDPGSNEIYLETKDVKGKRTKDSETYIVRLLSEKPSLAVTSPLQDEVFTKDTATLVGKTDEGVSVHVNGAPVVVTSDGSFRRELRLKEGDNTFTITATDIAGNQEEVELKVRYERD